MAFAGSQTHGCNAIAHSCVLFGVGYFGEDLGLRGLGFRV